MVSSTPSEVLSLHRIASPLNFLSKSTDFLFFRDRGMINAGSEVPNGYTISTFTPRPF